MSRVTDKQLDEMLDGLTVGGIYRLVWTLIKAWLGYVIGITIFGLIIMVIAGVAMGIFFSIVGG